MRIGQLSYNEFRENIDELISRYSENFYLPVVADWKEYEHRYKIGLNDITVELRSIVDTISSSIEVEEAGRPFLLNTRENAFLVLVKEITPRVKGSISPLLLGIAQECLVKQ